MGGDQNRVLLVTKAGTEAWERAGKDEVAQRLADRIAKELS